MAAQDPVIQSGPVSGFAPLTANNFAGLGNGAYGFTVTSAPPDTNGSVGLTQYVQWVNSSFAVFDKATGALVFGPSAGNSLWKGFGGGCEKNNDGDPIAQYDKAANRWVMSQFSVSTTPYLQCFAISTSSDATGTYYRYSFTMTNFPDYPKIGIWPDAYYASFNMFSGNSFVGPLACAFDRASMLTGAAATGQCFQRGTSYGGLLPSDLDGSTPPPPGSPNYFISYDVNALFLWKFHVDFQTPANSTFIGPSTIPVAAFTAACNGGGTCIPQAGTMQQLDSLADRLMYRLAYRNFGDHEALVVNHSVVAGSSVGLRWYELRNPNTTPTVFQQGTYAPDASFRWLGSISMDKVGNMAMGYSVSSTSLNPSIRFTGRTPAEPLGTMEVETNMINGTGSQLPKLSRWGDYSSMSIDPVDDCTFWYTTEYLKTNGTFNWSTQIANFKFPSCGTADFSLSATPASQSVIESQATSYSVTVTPTNGFNGAVGFSVSGLPTGATATFNPTTVNGSGSTTMTVQTLASTPTGTDPLIITGTSGAASHTASVSLVVNPPASGITATFVKTDATTQGNWRSGYGADGYNVIGDLASNPSYASPAASGQASYIWASSTSDIRALQKASNAADRIAGTWYSGSSFIIDSNITDTAPHQVALYCLDWDSTGRRETVDVLDVSGNVLNTQVLSASFNGGMYLVWNVTGHVKFRLTWNAGFNAVVSGLFFGGPVGSPPPTGTAAFVKTDSTTQGNWRSAYGADGYNVIGDFASNPSYAAPAASGQSFYTWAASSSDVRALQKATNSADRIAATWYGNSFLIDTNITDQAPHLVALYCLDWDTTTRRETIDVLDSNGTVLNTQSLTTSFNGGVYLVWNVTGHVKFRVTLTGGTNAVLSGLFFGGPAGAPPPPTATATFVKTDTATQGNWQTVYGADGYNIIGDLASNPSYAAPAASGQAFYTWAGSTADVRALQKASNPADRIAATWYSGTSFVIDTNITDQVTHQVALYCLDWDTTNRRQTIDVLDSNGTVLNTQALTTSFNGGVYLVWNVTGHVKFRLTWNAGFNAVISGLFFR